METLVNSLVKARSLLISLPWLVIVFTFHERKEVENIVGPASRRLGRPPLILPILVAMY